jgi:Cu2+-exporting ATPase
VAGSLNLGAPVAMRVERVGADTRYEAIVAMMRSARGQRPPTMHGADRWAAPFLWSVMLLAAGAAAVWSLVDPSRAVWVAVSVLIVTCPCALSLAAPSALLSSAVAMARGGVMLRRIEAIEGLARMQTLFVDKTGTLTEARGQGVQMIRIDLGPRWTDAMLRATAASLAAWSTHPLAKALARENEGNGAAWRELAETPGQGIQGRAVDASLWRLGRGPAVHAAANDADNAETWLSCDGTPVACFRFAETLRADAVAAVRALESDGVRIALISGDAPSRVERIGRQLGLADRRGGMTPQDKMAAVREAQARGERVGMLGDGINDAPVLAQADTSLAMGEGAQIARAQADGVLVSNALPDVVRARALAKKTLRVVRQNLVWAAAYNAACVPLALIGWLPPWAAGLGMATSSLVVVLNSLRLAR